MGISLRDVLEVLRALREDSFYFLQVISADEKYKKELLDILSYLEQLLREANEQRKGE